MAHPTTRLNDYVQNCNENRRDGDATYNLNIQTVCINMHITDTKAEFELHDLWLPFRMNYIVVGNLIHKYEQVCNCLKLSKSLRSHIIAANIINIRLNEIISNTIRLVVLNKLKVIKKR